MKIGFNVVYLLSESSVQVELVIKIEAYINKFGTIDRGLLIHVTSVVY